jgi:CMP/dCMP kinase
MIITIARQCGCDALEIGRLLSAHYGIPFYTRTGLREMAAEQGILDRIAEFFEEKPVDELMSAVTDYSYEKSAVCDKFRKAFADMIGDRDCVIIGRCGNAIFAGRKDLVSVFLHADIQRRIANIRSKENLSPREAEEFIRHTDECRVNYHRFYTGLSWGDSPDYDLSIDSGRLGAENSALLIEDYISKILPDR